MIKNVASWNNLALGEKRCQNKYVPVHTSHNRHWSPSAVYFYGIIYSVIQVVQDALLDSASAAIMIMEKWNLK